MADRKAASGLSSFSSGISNFAHPKNLSKKQKLIVVTQIFWRYIFNFFSLEMFLNVLQV